MNETEALSVFLCGDVMTGRGIDQVLPFPGDSVLYESHASDARDYVKLAERVHGPIERPVSFKYIWGDALPELERAGVDARIINLETSITSSDTPWPGKGIHYRMHPRNIGCLTAAGASACTLANNHVLDWGYEGLTETLQTLDKAGVAHAGAGCDEKRATDPAVLDFGRKGRLLLFSFGSVDSGVAREWGATGDQPGVNLLKDLSEDTASHAASRMRRFQQPGDMIIASVHWGSNWGYEIAKEKIKFAHQWIEEGIAIVHAHSSHHARGIEVYRDHLILYGCGDFINDYEGITGYEAFRSDLNLMYLVRIAPPDGRLISTRLVPLNMRRFRLNRASTEDTEWLCDLFNRLGLPFGTQVKLDKNLGMNLEWELGPAPA